jgi:hypothetical protein
MRRGSINIRPDVVDACITQVHCEDCKWERGYVYMAIRFCSHLSMSALVMHWVSHLIFAAWYACFQFNEERNPLGNSGMYIRPRLSQKFASTISRLPKHKYLHLQRKRDIIKILFNSIGTKNFNGTDFQGHTYFLSIASPKYGQILDFFQFSYLIMFWRKHVNRSLSLSFLYWLSCQNTII